MSRWENIGDKYLLNSLVGDEYAALQSVSMYLDPVAKCIEWYTNGHVIRLRPDLPSAIISGPFATSFGYEWNLAGGLVFGIGDVSLTKRAGKLDDWGLEGVQIYYIVPVGQIPNTPTVTIEKIDILDGMMSHLSLSPQGVLSDQDITENCSRVYDWVDHSMVINWKDKRNNNVLDNHSNYMAGKIIQKAPPLAHPLVCADLQAGNAGNRSFGAAGGSETIGQYEVLASGFQKQFNRQDLVDNRGVGTHYAFAATLGYTTVGSSSATWTNNNTAAIGPSSVSAGDYTIDACHFYCINSSTASLRTAMYDDSDLSLISSSDLSFAMNVLAAAEWKDHTYGVPPTVTLPSSVRLSFKHNNSGVITTYYDTLAADVMKYDLGVFYAAPWKDPFVVDGQIDRNLSYYFDITAGAAASIIPQIMHHRQQQRSA